MPNPNPSKMVGQTVLGWQVLFPSGKKGPFRLYRIKCARCGVEADRTSRNLGVMRAHEKAGKPGHGCKRCWHRERSRLAGPRICKWDGARTRLGDECEACRKRAAYNGRDEAGRPLGRACPNGSKAQARRRVRERMDSLRAERELAAVGGSGEKGAAP
jgi:hypothetical protein